MSDSDDQTRFYANAGNSIGYLSRLAFRSFSRALEKRTMRYGVSAGQWRFLRVLWEEEGLTQRELSRRVAMREPSTVTALKSLERSGFVKRKQSKEDRRRVHVFLTPQARALRDELLPFVAAVNETATRGMSPSEAAELRRLLSIVIGNLAEETAASEADLDE